jgi:hypothetical protein
MPMLESKVRRTLFTFKKFLTHIFARLPVLEAEYKNLAQGIYYKLVGGCTYFTNSV